MADQRATSVRPPLRIVLVDDHEVVRRGLADAVRDHRIEIVGEAATVDEAIAVIGRAAPDVIVLDVRLPGGGAPAVLNAVSWATGADLREAPTLPEQLMERLERPHE